MFWVRKRNVSGRRFFFAAKTYVIIDSYKIVHIKSLFSEYIFIPMFISNQRVFRSIGVRIFENLL